MFNPAFCVSKIRPQHAVDSKSDLSMLVKCC
eukprot:UN15436